MDSAMGGRFNPKEKLARATFQISPDEKEQTSNYEEFDWDPEDIEETSFEQDVPLAAYRGPRSRGLVGLTVISLILVAAVVAWLIIGKVQPTWAVAATDYIESSPTFSSWISGQPQAPAEAPEEPPKSPAAQLIVDRGSSGQAGEPLPLNVSVTDDPADARIVINGLAAGSTLNVGRASGVGGWQLMAADLREAVVRPTQGFAGAMELEIELRLENDIVTDRKTLRLQWAAPLVVQPAKPAIVVRHLDPDEITALLKRGENFIANGDLASARLVLQRAAEAGDAQAALSLAGTYDPIALERLGLQGPKADVEKARTWYQRAQELGSAAAPGRIELLAGYNR
jgi:hypothetical protein